MPIYKDTERGTWFVDLKYKDWQNKPKHHKKRGFKTQREAKAYERDFLSTVQNSSDISFNALSEIYLDDLKNRSKARTYQTAQYTVEHYILPYFSDFSVGAITPQIVRQWQNEIIKKNFSQNFYTNTHGRLSAIFNFGIKFFKLKYNPARICGAIKAQRQPKKMDFWTIEEFKKIQAELLKTSYPSYVFFTLIFYTGLRCGEALALTLDDIDLNKKTLSVNKTLSVIKGKTVINAPKTKNSIRTIDIPDFLCDIIRDYADKFYDLKGSDRIFFKSMSGYRYHIENAEKITGVKHIRVHDLRHSHASLLINNNVPILYISDRLGHKSVKMTLDIYSHLYPSNKTAVMELLSSLNDG